MPHKEFVKSRVGSSGLDIATRQQEQLSYFTESSVQENITSQYLNAWANRKYTSNDAFLNYVKSVFRTDNFLAFFKFLRKPIASSELINDRMKIPLSRVFFSEDAFFKYHIRGEIFHSIPELNSKKFDEVLFNALLFKHNSIIVTTLSDINTPFRELLDIDKVVAIDSQEGVIHRIAYNATLFIEEKEEDGILYIDQFQYIFMWDNFQRQIIVPHDLGETPADYIANEAFGDNDVVRKSMFSFVREKLEEYVFLKTLQRMTEPNGVIPITTMIQARNNKDGNDIKGQESDEPMQSNIVGGQKARFGEEIDNSDNLAQAGTVIKIKPVKKDDGSIDMNLIENYFNFFHMPTDPLNYVNTRIKEIEQGLIVSVLGDFSEAREDAKNELQVTSSFVSKQDKLRALSMEMSRIRNLSDFKFLALANGRDNVEVDCFYGSDFFLESEKDLFELYDKAPNPVERRDIIIKLSRNKNRFNPMKMERSMILYHLLPYCSDADFDKAVENKSVSPEIFDYQTRFSYWIGLFEAEFGDIVLFWNALEGSNSEKIVLINGLISGIITKANLVPKVIDDSASKNAQAALRGSVGGVTGIVSMLTALGQGQIKEASQVVKILTTLYGLSETDAKEIAEKGAVDIEKINGDN